MKKIVGVSVVLTAAIVLWQTWQSAPNPEARPETAVPAIQRASSSESIVPVTNTAELIVDDSRAKAPAVASALGDSAGTTIAESSSSLAPRENRGKLDSPRNSLPADTGSMAPLVPTDAVILEEEVNGQVVYQADLAKLGPDGFPLQLQAALQKEGGTAASSDLLAMLQSEESTEKKQEILCASSLLNPDQNTQAILEFALGSDQPQELRIAAVAYLADQDPSQLVSYMQDSDPNVSLEAQCAYENLTLPAPSVAMSFRAPPPPQNLATPPESINYARSR